MYNNKKILILGMARSGYEVAKLLYKNNEILITDSKDQNIDKILVYDIFSDQLYFYLIYEIFYP